MSRALDPETIILLQNGQHSAYIDIIEALKTKSEKLLEIEFLGKSHPLPAGTHVLIDGNNIAIPKVFLVEAFVVARRVLFDNVRDCLAEKEEELRDATGVILLMDSEHLTAANTRKRLIQKHLSRPSLEEAEVMIKDELRFVDSYLTSRLHRHAKSPTLWGHRRWLLERSRAMHMERAVRYDFQSVVLVAAERHPRNYYAWSHMRWLLANFQDPMYLDAASKSSSIGHADVICTIATDFCLRHPSDTSAFSFVLFTVLAPAFSDAMKTPEMLVKRSAICTEVLQLTSSFKWTHESVWVFLRTLIAAEGTLDADAVEFYKIAEEILSSNPTGYSVVKAARDWCLKYNQEICTSELRS